MVVGYTTTYAITITTKVVSLIPAHGEVYSIQHYVIKFVSDLRQVWVFLPSSTKTDHHDMNEILFLSVFDLFRFSIALKTYDLLSFR
jgi:hypothetical protein